MTCPACGRENAAGQNFCAGCGTKLNVPAPQPVQSEPIIPDEYKPIGAWGYVLWTYLFAMPGIGFILQIVLSICARNKNLRNYARSYLCMLLITLILSVVMIVIYLIIAAVMGVSLAAIFESMGAY